MCVHMGRNSTPCVTRESVAGADITDTHTHTHTHKHILSPPHTHTHVYTTSDYTHRNNTLVMRSIFLRVLQLRISQTTEKVVGLAAEKCTRKSFVIIDSISERCVCVCVCVCVCMCVVIQLQISRTTEWALGFWVPFTDLLVEWDHRSVPANSCLERESLSWEDHGAGGWCVCVCKREREREKQRYRLCMGVWVCVCVCHEGNTEIHIVCVCVCVKANCVCVCESEVISISIRNCISMSLDLHVSIVVSIRQYYI